MLSRETWVGALIESDRCVLPSPSRCWLVAASARTLLCPGSGSVGASLQRLQPRPGPAPGRADLAAGGRAGAVSAPQCRLLVRAPPGTRTARSSAAAAAARPCSHRAPRAPRPRLAQQQRGPRPRLGRVGRRAPTGRPEAPGAGARAAGGRAPGARAAASACRAARAARSRRSTQHVGSGAAVGSAGPRH